MKPHGDSDDRAGLRPAAPRGDAGFTLLEVMAALTIFLFGIVGVLALFTAGLGLHRDAQRKAMIAIASDEVRAAVETRLAKAVEGGADADLQPIEDVPIANHPGYFYSAELSVDPEVGVAGGVLADVFVFALDVGKERGSRFTIFVRSGARPENQIRKALGLGAVEVVPAEGGK
jgi:prepilin-type N-terminal cleavage/methylation domain-containing protein